MTVKKKATKNMPVAVGQKILKFGGGAGQTSLDKPVVDQASLAKAEPAAAAAAEVTETKPPAAGLSEEQMQKIAENKRKALERQQQKRSQSDTPGAPSPLKPEVPEAPSPLKPEVPEAPSPLKPEVPKPSKLKVQRASSPPTRPAVSPKPHTTPEKFSGPPNCADTTPQKIVAPKGPSTPGGTALSGRAVLGCGSKFEKLACGKWMQYNSIYAARFNELRSPAQAQAKILWSGDVAPQGFVSEIQQYKSGAGHEFVLVGILFKQMKARPNTIDQYKAPGIVGGLPETVDDATAQYWSDNDVLWLEDHTMRVKLLFAQDRISSLVSGLVVAVRGTRTEDGDFLVSSMCFTQIPEVVPLVPALPAGEEPGPFLAFISGLKIGAADSDLAAKRRLLEFLKGGDVPECDRRLSTAVKQVIICGGLFAGGAEGCSWRPTTISLEEADSTLVELASRVPVDLLPGRNEPTNLSFPQKALVPHLFPRAQACSGLRLAGNPYEREVGGMRVLGHAGQPVDDILRCSSISQPVHALTLTLEARHLAPTAPDTLATQPFVESDPFILNAMPHLIFSGGHSRAAHEWRSCTHGDSGTQCVCVPSFHDHPAVVLVNLRDPRDVRVKEFGESVASHDAEMGEVA